MYFWIFYTFISGITSLGFNYINRYVLRDGDDSTSYAWWFEFFRTVIFLPFCFFYLNFQFNPANILLFVAIGLAEFIGVYIYMKMHAFSDLSISTIVSQLRIVWVPILAFLFMGERLLPKEYFAIGLILVGQSIVAIKGKIHFDKGIKYALISSVFVSLNSLLAKQASGVFASPVIVLAMGLPSVFGFPILMKNGKVRIKNLGRSKWKKILLATVFNAITMLFLVLALKSGEVSKVIGLFQSLAVLGVVLGILFLDEKKNIRNKLLGALVVTMGVLMLV